MPSQHVQRQQPITHSTLYYTQIMPHHSSLPKSATVTQTISFLNVNIQGVSRLYGITAGGDFLGFCDQKSSYKHVSDFGWLRSYGHFLIPVHALV